MFVAVMPWLSRLKDLYWSSFSFESLYDKATLGDLTIGMGLNKFEIKANICFPGLKLVLIENFDNHPPHLKHQYKHWKDIIVLNVIKESPWCLKTDRIIPGSYQPRLCHNANTLRPTFSLGATIKLNPIGAMLLAMLIRPCWVKKLYRSYLS